MGYRAGALHAALFLLGLAMSGLVVFTTMENRSRAVQGGSSAQARAWVAVDPLNVPALRAYGLALFREGQLRKADAVLTFAGGRSWRDLETDRWLFEHSLLAGRRGEAFDEADAMLRLDLDDAFRGALIRVILLTLDDETARATLIPHLAGSPWWRPDFLRRLDADGSEDAARAILLALRKSTAPPTAEEYAPFIQRLIKRGAYKLALADWRRLTRPGEPVSAADASVDLGASSDGTPFTWSSVQGPGAVSSLDAGALRLDYDGFAAPSLPERLLALPAGRYRLSWRERQDPAGVSRIIWAVVCVGGSPVLARSEAASSANWSGRTLIFDVPSTGCPAQWVALQPVPGERRAAGVSWFQTPSIALLSEAPHPSLPGAPPGNYGPDGAGQNLQIQTQ